MNNLFFFFFEIGCRLLVLSISSPGLWLDHSRHACWSIYVIILSAGLGYGTQVIVTLLNFYYIIVLAWGIFYLYYSFSWDLPWSSCNNTWNTGKESGENRLECPIRSIELPSMLDFSPSQKTASSSRGETLPSPKRPTWTRLLPSWSSGSELSSCCFRARSGRFSLVDCFSSECSRPRRRRALRISSGIDQMGSLNWDMALCLLIAWVMCYFCIWKGVKSTGKVGRDQKMKLCPNLNSITRRRCAFEGLGGASRETSAICFGRIRVCVCLTLVSLAVIGGLLHRDLSLSDAGCAVSQRTHSAWCRDWHSVLSVPRSGSTGWSTGTVRERNHLKNSLIRLIKDSEGQKNPDIPWFSAGKQRISKICFKAKRVND